MHVPKQGYNPFDNLNPDGPRNFGFSSNRNQPLAFPTYLRTIMPDGVIRSRLENLQLTKIDNIAAPSEQNLLTYSGGPGAILGVGKTRIPITSRTTFQPTDVNFYGSGTSNSIGKSVLSYNELFNVMTDPSDQNAVISALNMYGRGGALGSIPLIKSKSIPRVPNSQGGTNLTNPNFQQTLGPSQTRPSTIAWEFDKQFEQRVNLGNPGKRGNLSSYTIGKRDINTSISGSISNNSGYKNAVDKINAFPLYKSTSVTSDNDKNDFVKFRIGVIDNKNPSEKTYIHFRALINQLSDSYEAEWQGTKFAGRGEQLFNYQGFDRTINLSWTVAAQSKQELIPMYQKLNYLASVCAPDYSDSGYMRGNLIELTIGGWCYQQMGIMEGITLGVPQESPWEIGINDSAIAGQGFDDNRSDNTVKEMPMIVNVSGFTFKPIQSFVPNKQINNFKSTGEAGPDQQGNIASFGPQRYISLGDGDNNNYDENNYI